MPTDLILSREEIERIAAADPWPDDAGLQGNPGLSEYLKRSQVAIWPITNAQLRALVRHALSEPTRLASARQDGRQEGYREGVEAAARWHDERASVCAKWHNYDEHGDTCRAADDHREHAAAIRTLIPATEAPAWTPTHRHYKGGLYRELMRVEGADGDDLVPMVIYEDAAGRRFARAAEAFDGLVDISPKHGARRFTPIRLDKPAEPGDGWIEWKGGECPVPDGLDTEVRYGDGVIYRTTHPASQAGWDWHSGRCLAWACIVAYRIVEPAEPSAPVAPAVGVDPGDPAGDRTVYFTTATAEQVATLEAENAALRERNKALEDGLRPFAEIADWYGEPMADDRGVEIERPYGHFRRARALLQGGG